MLLVYALAMLHSAALLFVVQPLVGKMILPALGGTPAVWNTCMVFFQAVLLAGYGYAHVTRVLLGARKQAVLHLLVLLLPLVVLPIALDTSGVPRSADNPIPWLLARLALGVGLPFFVLSTHAPLLQSWFSHTGHRSAHDPYFLYAASNTGSLAALLGYPIVVERYLPLATQARWWMYGYAGMIVLAAACAILMWRSRRGAAGAESDVPLAPEALAAPVAEAPMTWRRRLYWLALAFVPSSHLLAVTTHVTTELAPIPLLWVVPLALYLVTFIIVFARKPIISRSFTRSGAMLLLVPTGVMVLLNRELGDLGGLVVAFLLHLCTFFFVALACHGALADDRPSPARLTEFYLLLSLGGVLGGAFNALLAPMVFTRLIEYPLILVAAALLVPRAGVPARQPWKLLPDLALPLGAAAVVVVVIGQFTPRTSSVLQNSAWALALPIAAGWLMWSRRFRLLVLTVALAAAAPLWVERDKQTVKATERNFYGVKQVKGDSDRITLVHGRTVHGMEPVDPAWRDYPLTYYNRLGPVGDLFGVYNTRPATPRIAVVGLGIGTMAIYVSPGHALDYYEIDPQVVRLARDQRYFHYLEDCPGSYRILLGDGRLALAEAPDGAYGAIFLDAFSSDAIPTHLLTREAIRLYFRKIADGGFLAVHVSNKYVRLAPVLGALAADGGLVFRTRFDAVSLEETKQTKRLSSHWVVLARRDEDLGDIAAKPTWVALNPRLFGRVWTDQFTNVWGAMRQPRWMNPANWIR